MTITVSARRYFERRATASAWTAANPILGAGEIGVDLTNNEIRIGDGAKRWNQIMPLGTVDEAMVDSVATAAGKAAVEQYLEENPPATTIVATPHPTFAGVVIVTTGSTTPPVNPGAPTLSEGQGYASSRAPDFGIAMNVTGDPAPVAASFTFETKEGDGPWVTRTATPNPPNSGAILGFAEWVIIAPVPDPYLRFQVRATVTTTSGTFTHVFDVEIS